MKTTAFTIWLLWACNKTPGDANSSTRAKTNGHFSVEVALFFSFWYLSVSVAFGGWAVSAEVCGYMLTRYVLGGLSANNAHASHLAIERETNGQPRQQGKRKKKEAVNLRIATKCHCEALASAPAWEHCGIWPGGA